MRPFMGLVTAFQVLQAAGIVQLTTRTQDLVRPLSVSSQATTPVESENYRAPYTTETPTPDILVKTGVQVRTGLVFLGRMPKETSQETPQPKTTTSGIQMLQR